MSETEFKKGDHVQWKSAQGNITGTVRTSFSEFSEFWLLVKVEEKVTEPIQIKGHTAKASEDNPEFLVKSDKTGKEAVHKPESLKRVEERSDDADSGHTSNAQNPSP